MEGYAMRGGTCPRCRGYTGLGHRTDRQYQHRTPYGSRCPAGGITWQQARDGWTSLALTTYKYLVRQGRTDDAEEYRKGRAKP